MILFHVSFFYNTIPTFQLTYIISYHIYLLPSSITIRVIILYEGKITVKMNKLVSFILRLYTSPLISLYRHISLDIKTVWSTVTTISFYKQDWILHPKDKFYRFSLMIYIFISITYLCCILQASIYIYGLYDEIKHF